jgi:hypothetical protein
MPRSSLLPLKQQPMVLQRRRPMAQQQPKQKVQKLQRLHQLREQS